MFIVKYIMASCSYLSCQNDFWDTFPSSPKPNKLTISYLMNHFHHRRNSSLGYTKHEWMHALFNSGHFQQLMWHHFCILISIYLFFWQIEHVSIISCVTFWSSLWPTAYSLNTLTNWLEIWDKKHWKWYKH